MRNGWRWAASAGRIASGGAYGEGSAAGLAAPSYGTASGSSSRGKAIPSSKGPSEFLRSTSADFGVWMSVVSIAVHTDELARLPLSNSDSRRFI